MSINRPKKKMTAECGGLYFMFLAPPPSPKFLDPLLGILVNCPLGFRAKVKYRYRRCKCLHMPPTSV